ncbi:MAG: T9SS type A sorting domain-containing protein, partial [Tannerellaceae bacterium]|nr:T9SS type A sorting domain-containing protein [Tannerellaceae bacterium]
ASNELTVTPDTSVSQLSPLLPSSGAATNNYTVYLYNAGGAVVKQAVSRQGGEVRLDVSGLPNGIYYLLIDAGNGAKPESHKIIINH